MDLNYEFFNHDINKFILAKKYLLIWIYGSLGKIWIDITLFYSLNMEDITGGDFRHVKRVWEDFEIKTEAITMIYMFGATNICWLMYFGTFKICLKINVVKLSHSFCTRNRMASSHKKDKSRVRTTDWNWYVTNGRKKLQKWNMPCYSSRREN